MSPSVQAFGAVISLLFMVIGISALPSPNTAHFTPAEGYMSLMRLCTNKRYTYNTTSNDPNVTTISLNWYDDCEKAIKGGFCASFPSESPGTTVWSLNQTGRCSIGYFWPPGLSVDFSPYGSPGDTSPRWYCEQVLSVLSDMIGRALASIDPPPDCTYAEGSNDNNGAKTTASPAAVKSCTYPSTLPNRASNNIDTSKLDAFGLASYYYTSEDVSWYIRGAAGAPL